MADKCSRFYFLCCNKIHTGRSYLRSILVSCITDEISSSYISPLSFFSKLCNVSDSGMEYMHLCLSISTAQIFGISRLFNILIISISNCLNMPFFILIKVIPFLLFIFKSYISFPFSN